MSIAEFEPRAAFELLREHLAPSELAEVGTAALNFPAALARAMNVHAGEKYTHEAFAQLMLRIARDVNKRRGMPS